MKSFFEGRRRFSISASCLLSFALTLGSASVLSGCDNDKSTTETVEQTDKPAEIAKDSMNFYKGAHLKGAAGKHK
jgi:hypothetical protein